MVYSAMRRISSSSSTTRAVMPAELSGVVLRARRNFSSVCVCSSSRMTHVHSACLGKSRSLHEQLRQEGQTTESGLVTHWHHSTFARTTAEPQEGQGSELGNWV